MIDDMKRIFIIAAALVLLVSASCSPRLYERRPGVVRIATYNVGVFGKYEESGYAHTASLMKELAPDVLVMNELDSCARRTGGDYQLECFIEAMGENWDGRFAPALKPYQGGAYGIAQAWDRDRQTAVGGFSMMLPKCDGSETRALTVVEYEDMVVAGTHLEVKTENARLAQLDMITDTLKTLYGASGKPVFLCGDFNSIPGSGLMERAAENWDVLSPVKTTFPREDKWEGRHQLPDTADDMPGICIDYILLLRNGAECSVVAADVCVTFRSGSAFTASDHLPVYVDVKF